VPDTLIETTWATLVTGTNSHWRWILLSRYLELRLTKGEARLKSDGSITEEYAKKRFFWLSARSKMNTIEEIIRRCTAR